MQLKQPYLAKQMLAVGSALALTSDVLTAPDKTALLFIQVQAGHTIHYETCPAGQTQVIASSTSPTLSGDTVLQFGPQWTLSVIESTE